MNQYRYILDKGSKKHKCPACENKSFVYYIDIETNEYLPIQYGRCDREVKCGYFLNPYSDGFVKGLKENKNHLSTTFAKNKKKDEKESHEANYIPKEILVKTLQIERYEVNQFLQNLLKNVPFPFYSYDVENIISLYYLGTIAQGYRKGAITFPFIDIQYKLRAIQVKEFDSNNHTKSTDSLASIIKKYYEKNKKPLPNWLELYEKGTKFSCLFGEHLLSKYPYNPIALVEAPKTAIYCTLYFGFPKISNNFIWLAVYNLSSFSFNRLKVLEGRTVFVFPDLSTNGETFNRWWNKAQEIEKQLVDTKFIFSDLLERLGDEENKDKGNDIGDYLIKLDWRDFRSDLYNYL